MYGLKPVPFKLTYSPSHNSLKKQILRYAQDDKTYSMNF